MTLGIAAGQTCLGDSPERPPEGSRPAAGNHPGKMMPVASAQRRFGHRENAATVGKTVHAKMGCRPAGP